jgi:hypothetical protein
VRRDSGKIVVRREKCQFVSNTELREKRVDGAYLNACSATTVAQLRCVDVVLAVWRKQRQRTEAIDDLTSIARARESLKQFL